MPLYPPWLAFFLLAIKLDAAPFCTRKSLAKGGFFHEKISQSLERRFVGFVKPSNQRSFCVSGQIKGGSPERSSICENQQGHWRGGSMSDSQRPTSRSRRSRYSAMSTSGVRAVPTHATASSAGTGVEAVCAQIWKKSKGEANDDASGSQ